jgi:hypothetical protein
VAAQQPVEPEHLLNCTRTYPGPDSGHQNVDSTVACPDASRQSTSDFQRHSTRQNVPATAQLAGEESPLRMQYYNRGGGGLTRVQTRKAGLQTSLLLLECMVDFILANFTR